MIIGNFIGNYSGSGGEGSLEEPSDWFGDSLVFWMNPSRLSSMMVEQAYTGVPVTAVANDGDSVGTIYEQGYHGFIARAESDARRPVLGSSAERNAYLTFDGVDDFLRVPNTQKYLNAFHKASPVWSIVFWIKMGTSTDGAAVQYILANHGNTTAQAGIVISRSAANKIVLLGSKASAGNNVFSYTSTATLRESSGWTLVFIEVNGTGAAAGRIKIGSAAWETFNVNPGAAVDATADFTIGALNTPASYFKGDIGDLIVLNRTLTSEDITRLEGYNPLKTTTRFTPILQWRIDFDADARIFADTTATTPITNGTAIRLIQHNQDSIFGPLNRQLTSAASGSSPIWRDAEKNGKATAEYDGVDDNLDFGVSPMLEGGGIWTEFVVFKNDDVTVGSNFLKGSASYQVVTGTNYSGNSLNGGNPYMLIHTNAGTTVPVSGSSLKNGGEGYNIFTIIRNGSSWTIIDQNDVEYTGTDSGQHMMTDMGEQFNPNFWTDGMWCIFEKHNGAMTIAEAKARRDELVMAYAL